MAPTNLEWTYDEHGNIIDLYMFKSDILDIPDQDALDELIYYEALADLEANGETNPGA